MKIPNAKDSYVIAIGTPFEGITLYGPFESQRAAADWHEDIGLADTSEPTSAIIHLKTDY